MLIRSGWLMVVYNFAVFLLIFCLFYQLLKKVTEISGCNFEFSLFLLAILTVLASCILKFCY
jgi:hypothetical protein